MMNRLLRFMDDPSDGISNVKLILSLFGISIGACLCNEVTSHCQLKNLAGDDSVNTEMIFEAKELKVNELKMKRDVIRFSSLSCAASSLSALLISTFDNLPLRTLLVFGNAASPAIIAWVLDRTTLHSYTQSLYDTNELTHLPYLKVEGNPRKKQYALWTFFKQLFTPQSTFVAILTALGVPIISTLISNRLIPTVSWSSTSRLMLNGYRQTIAEMVSSQSSPNDIAELQTLVDNLEDKNYMGLIGKALTLGLLAGTSICALYSAGEERGMRDYLWNRLQKISVTGSRKNYVNITQFFLNSMTTGLVHGIWSLPFVLLGQNFGYLNSRWGVLNVLTNSVLMAPILCYFTQKIKRDADLKRDYGLVSSMFRGVLYSCGGLSYYLSDIALKEKSYGNLIVGPQSINTNLTFLMMDIALLGAMYFNSRHTCSSTLV